MIKFYRLTILSLLLLFAAFLVIAPQVFGRPPADITNLDGLHLQGSFATATPAFMVDQQGLGVVAEFRDGATPVAHIPNGGGLTIDSGGLTISSGGLSVTAGALTASGGLRLTAQTETVTGSWTITPTASYIVLTSTLEVTSSTTAAITTTAAVAGDIVVLRNGNASDAINIDGTGGTIECKADVALGASDTLTLIFNGTEWNCIATYDNS